MTDLQPRLPDVDPVEELRAQLERMRQDVHGQQQINIALKRENMRLTNAAKNERAHGMLTPMVRRIYERWLRRTEKNPKRTLLTDDRFDKIAARIREGRTEDDTNFIIDVLPHIAFRKDGKTYDDIELVCRSGSQWENFYERAERFVARGPVPKEPLPHELRRHLTSLSTPQLHKLVRLCEPCDCGHLYVDHTLETLEPQRYGWKPCLECTCLDFSDYELRIEEFLRQAA